jgi:hypothetical protein
MADNQGILKKDKKKKRKFNSNYPELEFKGGKQGLMRIFRACKRIQASTKGRDFK